MRCSVAVAKFSVAQNASRLLFAGIGKETARVLALAGARVIFTCRNANVGQQVVAELSQEALKVARAYTTS